MEISKRITGLTGGESEGWDLFLKARQMIRDGISVTELTIGEHDIRTDKSILDAMHASALGGHTGYASVPGVQELRQEIANRVQNRTGTKTGWENVIITPGGQSALFASHMALCDPGDRALFLDPYYTTYPGCIRGAGAIPVAIPTSPENSFQPTYSELNAKAHDATSLLVNSPNNPTGVVYSRKTMDTIAQVSQEQDLWLISDEVYDTQIWEGEHISPRSLPGMAERSLVIGSMSKSHAMTGSRVGWIIGPKSVITELSKLATHTTYGVAGFVQDAALYALQQGQPFEEMIAAPFKRRRAIIRRLIGGQNAIHLVPSSGAMYAMLDVRSTGLSGEDFAYALLEQEHIAVMPGESFGSCAAGHIRVAMTIEDDVFEDAVHRLLKFAGGLIK